jgi:hypothetical protein
MEQLAGRKGFLKIRKHDIVRFAMGQAPSLQAQSPSSKREAQAAI